MNDIVLIGPQGSGKGTQSTHLSEVVGMPHISLGTLFRAEVTAGTDTGKAIESYMLRGDIVPSEIASEVIARRLAASDAANGVILDGFPRTLGQADMLDNILAPLGRHLAHVVYLNVSDEEAMRRIGGRLVCTNTACERNYHATDHPPKVAGVCDKCSGPVAQRKDDTPDAIRHRLSIYHAETMPLIALYQGLGLLREIDGHRTIDAVHSGILQAIGKA